MTLQDDVRSVPLKEDRPSGGQPLTLGGQAQTPPELRAGREGQVMPSPRPRAASLVPRGRDRGLWAGVAIGGLLLALNAALLVAALTAT